MRDTCTAVNLYPRQELPSLYLLPSAICKPNDFLFFLFPARSLYAAHSTKDLALCSGVPFAFLAAFRHSREPERARIDREPISCHANIRGHLFLSPTFCSTPEHTEPFSVCSVHSLVSIVSLNYRCIHRNFLIAVTFRRSACRSTPHILNGPACDPTVTQRAGA